MDPTEDGHKNESEHEGLPGNFTEKIIQHIVQTLIRTVIEKVNHIVLESAVSSRVYSACVIVSITKALLRGNHCLIW